MYVHLIVFVYVYYLCAYMHISVHIYVCVRMQIYQTPIGTPMEAYVHTHEGIHVYVCTVYVYLSLLYLYAFSQVYA